MGHYNFMDECNSAGNCFFVRWKRTDNTDEYLVDICDDEKRTNVVESYHLTIKVRDEWSDETKHLWVEQEISNSVRKTIEYL